MRKHVKVMETVFFLILFAQLSSLFLVRPLNIFPISYIRRSGVMFIGFDFICLGVLGLLKKSILLTRTQPLNYGESSHIGKTVNGIFIILGSLLLVLGIWKLISGVSITD